MSEKALEFHLDNNHIDSRVKELQKNVYKCAICSFQTLHISNLRKHKNVHLALEERQLFACTHCDKKYTSKQSLKHHLEDNHIDSRTKKSQRKVFTCAICIFQTRHKSHFNQHMKVHLAPEELQFFACAHCDKKYKSKQTLKYHIEDNHIDTRNIVYRCATCNYKTQRKAHFRQHKQIHWAPEERQLFACTHCKSKYTTNSSLQRHLKRVHVDSRNANCISSTDEVILDSLKIEIDDHAPLTDDFRNAECLPATNEVKTEDFF
ncbi:gastrula zinc finger protein XlCGF26.1-like isoform X4 [Sitophilus oryzae]|uniref:Gastrula zinc finger protein XlCGF26.1-like isoform X4 n=1 Tax=Sitophilus oryzae TaxID=7048 RepID=A0A6J2X592_SITOR|nr:gastrula zinc finger protein XlCGF26.1-like isoform X4 [Sitophilus oryzae]